MGKRGRKRVQTGWRSGGAPTFARRGGAHPAKLQFFLGRAVCGGAFFRPCPRGGRPAHGDRLTRTRDARVHRFSIFSFTASPYGRKRLNASGLRVKVSPVCVHTPFALNLLEIRVLWVKASLRGRLHPLIGAARTGWERGKARVKAKRLKTSHTTACV